MTGNKDTSGGFYNWSKALSFDAPVTMICTARGKGKTYGLRKQCVRDFLKHGHRFVAVVRYKSKINKVANNFFNRLIENDEFPGVSFKTQGRYAYVSVSYDPDTKKPDWQLAGYFVALSEAQDTKEMTFSQVKRLFLDEFILDSMDKHRRYLADEYTKFVTIVDSVFRENVNAENPIEPRIYLIGNALNIVNPYFEAFNIYNLPDKGFSWHCGKTVLFHYSDDAEYSKQKAEKTLAGKLYALSSQSKQNVNNEFIVRNLENIRKKTSNAIFVFGLVWKGRKFGVWADSQTENYYINSQIPPYREEIYALSLDDKEFNFRVAQKNERRIRSLYELFCANAVFFDKEMTRQAMFEIFALFGARIG